MRKQCNHTPAPTSYLEWNEWAQTKARTHYQEECPACGLWEIWKPKVKKTYRKTPPHGKIHTFIEGSATSLCSVASFGNTEEVTEAERNHGLRCQLCRTKERQKGAMFKV